jgi:hypothetical protein
MMRRRHAALAVETAPNTGARAVGHSAQILFSRFDEPRLLEQMELGLIIGALGSDFRFGSMVLIKSSIGGLGR